MRQRPPRLLILLSRISARFGLWMLTIAILRHVRPYGRLSQIDGGRLGYAFTLAYGHRGVRGMFADMVRREIDVSPDTNELLSGIARRLGMYRLAQLIDLRTRKLAPNSRQAVAAEYEAGFSRAAENGELLSTFAQAVSPPLDEGVRVIVLPLSRRHLPLFALWKQQLDLHASDELVVLALDSATARAVANGNQCRLIDLSPYFQIEHEGTLEDQSKRRLWVARVMLLRYLVARGISVVSFDVDAVLVGNLGQMLRSFPASDIVAQQDYSIPMDVARKLGFVICCGFMMIRSNPATITFLDRYAQRTLRELDDQTALNHLLVESGISKLSRHPTYLSFESAGLKWTCPSTSLVSRDLKSGSVIRHFQQRGESIAELRRGLGLVPTA